MNDVDVAALRDRGSARAPASGRKRDPALPFGLAAAGAPLCWQESTAYFAITGAIVAVIGLRNFPSVLEGSLVNPDTYMRFVRLREIISQHAPVDIIARDSSGTGTLLNWSHLIDSLLLLFAAPLSLVMSEDRALHWVALAFGPIAAGLLILTAVWAMAPLTHRRWRWLAPVLAALSPAIVGFGVPGEVHHRIPVAGAIVMMAGWALRSSWRGATAGRVMGAWAAVAIWLTPESMPFILAAFGGLGLFWLLHPENRNSSAALRSAGASFLVLIGAALAVDPPFGGYASAPIVRLSIVYLVLAAVLWIFGLTASRLDELRMPPIPRSLIGILTALAGLGIWFAAFPAVLAGPYGLLSARDTWIFFGAISDMQPIENMPDVFAFLITGVLAVICGGIIAVRARSPLWGFAIFCAGLTIVLGVVHRRFAIYPEVVAVAMLPVIMSAFDGPLERRPGLPLGAARLAILSMFLLLPQAARFPALFLPKEAVAASRPGCDPRTLQRALASHAGQIVLGDPGDTPGLLYWTKVQTVASLFIWDIDAFLRLRAAWRSAPAEAEPDAVRATHAALVLVCPQSRRPLFVTDLPPDTLWDRLDAGEPPPWLIPLDAAGAGGYRLYRIAHAGR